MRQFCDNAERCWTFAIHVAAIKRVRGLLGIDLFALVDDQFQGLSKLLADPVALVDVLYVLCKDDADRLNVTDEEFGRAMWGDAIGQATDAFLAELTDFFPDARVRAGITKVLDAARTLKDRLLTEALDQVDSVNLDSAVARSRTSSGISPESSASIPGRSPSAS